MKFTIRVWAKSGPRDQVNCMNGWGKRTVTVDASDWNDAIGKAVVLVGRDSYGGLVDMASDLACGPLCEIDN